AKKRFGLSEDTVVVSCYEAGRDGFWLHRWLVAHGIVNLIVDAASIELPRRYRRAKTDRLDAGKLVSMLVRYHQGEKKVWSVVRVPSPEEEDRRHLHRQLLDLKGLQTLHTNRIRGLLASVGIRLGAIQANFASVLEELRTWDGQPLLPGLAARLMREFELLQQVRRQLWSLERQRNRAVRDGQDPVMHKVQQLISLRAIGPHSAWVFVMEVFGWRSFRNRRQLAALLGLTPTPYTSGDSAQE